MPNRQLPSPEDLQRWLLSGTFHHFSTNDTPSSPSSSPSTPFLLSTPPFSNSLTFVHQMPSLFSRSRTQSSPLSKSSFFDDRASQNLDEFGRVHTRGSAPTSPTGKKDNKTKKKDKDQDRPRSRTPAGHNDYDLTSTIPDGSFLPFCLDRPRNDSATEERQKDHDYGYLSYARHVILGLEQAERLVGVVTDELHTRGLTTPFIFTSLSLNVSSSAIKRLIQSFLNTCSSPSANDVGRNWLEEASFASPQELGMFLRWGLARIVRYAGGEDVRGLLSWEQYNMFRESEAALNYPPAHFETFLLQLNDLHVANILVKLLTLLIGLSAHSSSSGHTPPTLSPLFGPLIFGLGPATLPFHHAYIHYLRSANATEHLILAFIRWQDTPRSPNQNPLSFPTSYSTPALGVPMRLKYWIRRYPFAMLPFLEDRTHKMKPQPRRGARTVRVLSVRRNVRMYSPDLVKTCASWAQRSAPGARLNDLATSKVWERISPPALKLPPQYSDNFKKRMDLPSNFHPDVGAFGAVNFASKLSTGSSNSGSDDGLSLGLGLGEGPLLGRVGEDRFTSLADMRWDKFETMGFAGLGTTEKKLQFDLTEGARTARAAKRTTLNWNDFSVAGFSRTDGPLSATLQFSTPVTNTISSWPSHSAEISKKLKKTQKALPPFGWDTEPVMGQEEVIEEAFLDVFCDLVYGGGWMDLERVEETDRECNWALVEFKAVPYDQTVAPSPGADPRSAHCVMLFEEFVPLEYRQQLLASSNSRPRFRSLFHTRSSKQWKPAPTLNGRPYVVGLVPQSPTLRELEFDTLLKSSTGTKVISLTSHPSARGANTSHPGDAHRISTMSTAPDPRNSVAPQKATPRVAVSDTNQPQAPAKRTSRFRLPGGIPVPTTSGVRKSGIAPAEYSTVDFETRLASYSDDEYNSSPSGPDSSKKRHERRESRDDAWVDILVSSQDRRLGGQDAELKRPGQRRLRPGRSDPELAKQEVAKALAAVKDRAPSTDDGASAVVEPITHPADVSFEPIAGDIAVLVDEVQTVPSAKRLAVLEDLHADEPTYPPTVLAARRKTLGYFDMHPDRRPAQARPSFEDEDPRALLHADSDDDADDEEGGAPDEVEGSLPQPLPKLRSSTDSAADELEAPALPPPGPVRIEIPEWTGPPYKPEEEKEQPTSTAPNGNHPPSKTAALIEMYQQRDQGNVVSPSRLPVRASPKESVTPALSSVSSPSQIRSPSQLLPLQDPLTVEDGRHSPGRYYHGAPLHNVLEEEEEEV